MLDFKKIKEINKSFDNIEDMVRAFYTPNGLVNKALVEQGLTNNNYVNNIYGAKTFSELNNLKQVLGVLPKSVYKNSGFRVVTAFSSDIGGGGTAEGGMLNTEQFPTVETVNMTIKIIHHSFGESLQKSLRTNDDDVTYEELKELRKNEHLISISRMLVADVDTPAGNNLESIDRVCSAQSEGSLLSAVSDNDIYSIDRSATTAFDAYVDAKAATGDDNRDLTRDMIRDAIRSIYENSGEYPTVVVTRGDTAVAIDRIYQGAHRLLLQNVQVGVNGIQTRVGNDSGFQVSSVENGIPVIVDDNIVRDGTGIGRIYFLNTNKNSMNSSEYNLSLAFAVPTQTIESNINTNIFARGFKKEGVHFTAGELKCTKFSAQGKIRDIQQAS